jgi:hypothetical protein
VRHPCHLSTILHRATCPSLPRRRLPRPRVGRPWPLHVAPVACPSRASPPLAVAATQHHLLLPGDPTCRFPAGRCRSSPRCLLICAPRYLPPLPEPRRGRHARRRLSALAPARPHLSLDSEHLLELLACLLLHLHTLFSLNFSCSDHHTSPDIIRGFGSPSAAPTAAPHPRSKVPTAPP